MVSFIARAAAIEARLLGLLRRFDVRGVAPLSPLFGLNLMALSWSIDDADKLDSVDVVVLGGDDGIP